MEKVKAIQYGVGKMAVYTMRYMLEKGIEIIGAVDVNPDVVGKDIGEIMGMNKLGINVTDGKDAKELLEEKKPDICVVETRSFIGELEKPLILCASKGINVITTSEEAFFPMNSNPELTKKIDELARKNNCTITGSGYQDIYWGQLVTSIAGSTQKISKIKGTSSYNVEQFGEALAEANGVGCTLSEFKEKIASVNNVSDSEKQKMIKAGDYIPSYMWNANGWLCEKLGLTVKKQSQKCIPQTYSEDLYSSTMNMTIKAGDVIGMNAVVTTETEQGIVLETECMGKVYTENDCDRNIWTVEGEPTTTVNVDKPDIARLTCASVVNRIPDVISSKPGYVPTEQFGELTYKSTIEK